MSEFQRGAGREVDLPLAGSLTSDCSGAKARSLELHPGLSRGCRGPRFGPSSAAFSVACSGCWIRSGAAGMLTDAYMEGQVAEQYWGGRCKILHDKQTFVFVS